MANGYYMLRVSHINRATRNIVACASYRSDDALFSERTNEKIKFRNHSVQPESFILTPENTPDWATDRERLWNEVDKIEKKNTKTKSPRLATEVLLSLPNDLERNVQRELVNNFVNDEFISRGMIADVSIHRDDINNPHAHILLTIRPLNADGTWGNKTVTRTKYDENGTPVLNKNGNKVRVQERFAELDLKNLRKNWEDKLNQFAERENSERRYDSRSFIAQGREQIAHIHLTRAEYHLEEKEKRRCKKLNIEYKPITYYGKLNKDIADYNKGLLNDVSINEEQNKKQNEFNHIVEEANNVVNFHKEAKKVLDKRIKGNAGYIEAKDTLNQLNIEASPYGRKVQNQLLKNELSIKYIRKLNEIFEKDNNKIKDYGFNPETFKDEIIVKGEELEEERYKLLKEEDIRNTNYYAGKHIYESYNALNDFIVKNMYPNNEIDLTNDEKAFVVYEAHKGNFMDYSQIEYEFKQSDYIPRTLTNKDVYMLASKDMFFAKREQKSDINNKNDSMMFNVNELFIEQKMLELNKHQYFIDDELSQLLPKNHKHLVDDLTNYSKTQLIGKLERYNNVPVDEIIEKHIADEKNENKGKKEFIQSNKLLALSNHLLYTMTQLFQSQEQEQQNQTNKKKKKEEKRMWSR
ncbi:MobA/MobL family protein (plasmid) [Macrococcus psychrotolerans]|uniref:MobA/MobL family protein n=1 Tax=Macrococcus psychrotolerans TaxID=3039389 RepID=A0AAT9P6N1_9STAP|nr:MULTISPECIES: MobA/MobL family protein [Macrococcus]QYA34000.1 MobA/MobL family protein [Macrococcus sp. 19Msa1099]QYA38786.1 MobA/MobL family protein [Macrococcus caseolyticus]QYA77511.1 MobA/MobL family protein [Macrococcus caseolyticus]